VHNKKNKFSFLPFIAISGSKITTRKRKRSNHLDINWKKNLNKPFKIDTKEEKNTIENVKKRYNIRCLKVLFFQTIIL
jgi:hypothetical protein